MKTLMICLGLLAFFTIFGVAFIYNALNQKDPKKFKLFSDASVLIWQVVSLGTIILFVGGWLEGKFLPEDNLLRYVLSAMTGFSFGGVYYYIIRR